MVGLRATWWIIYAEGNGVYRARFHATEPQHAFMYPENPTDIVGELAFVKKVLYDEYFRTPIEGRKPIGDNAIEIWV